MAAATVVEIVEQLAAVLEGAIGTDVRQVVPYRNFNPTPPSIDVYWPDTDILDDLGAGFGNIDGRLVFTVRARVSTAENESGQYLLYQLVDSEDDLSVAAALEDDQTLGGYASSVDCGPPSGHLQFADAGGEGALLGVQWQVTVLRGES